MLIVSDEQTVRPPSLEKNCAKFMLSLATSNIPNVHIEKIGSTVTELLNEQKRLLTDTVQKEHGIDVGGLFPCHGFTRLATQHTRMRYFKEKFNLIVSS